MRRLNKTAICMFFIFIIVNTLAVSALEVKSVEVNPKEIVPGETAIISLDVKNTFSEDIENINVMLDFSSESIPIAPYQGSSERGVDELNEGDNEDFVFNIIVLPEASSGIYKIPVKITYEINGTQKQKTSIISVIVNSPTKLNAIVDGVLIRGMEKEVTLRIINEGLSDIKFLSVQIQQPTNGKIISPLYEYLGDIESDDFDSIEIKIFADNKPSGTLSLPIKINYKDSTNKDFSDDKIIQIKVYSQDEAKKLGLINSKNNLIYFVFAAIVLIFIIYRIRKSFNKKLSK